MSSRFVMAFVAAFLGSLAVLAAAGASISYMGSRAPRDPFRNALFEFDLAPGWSCDLEDTDYVCTPPGPLPRSAIAVIAMKDRNADDNLKAYQDHLTAELAKSAAAGTQDAARQYVRRIRLGSRDWVEALLFGSEMPNYDTFYLGTNTSDVGILVTMSVHKDRRDVHVRELTDMMSTLNVYQR